MKSLARLIAVAVISAVGGCNTVGGPATILMTDGTKLTGSALATVDVGKFEVHDNRGLSCSGTYDPLDVSPTLTAATSCTDGRTGTVVVNRTRDRQGGTGTVRFSDGSTGAVAFGSMNNSVSVGAVRLTAAQINLIKAGIIGGLKDPESARFGEIAAATTAKGKTVACGYVNAKNSFGGYTGMEPFAGLLTEKAFIPINHGDTAPMQTFVLDECHKAGVLI
jgi:hypothetical protein